MVVIQDKMHIIIVIIVKDLISTSDFDHYYWKDKYDVDLSEGDQTTFDELVAEVKEKKTDCNSLIEETV